MKSKANLSLTAKKQVDFYEFQELGFDYVN